MTARSIGVRRGEMHACAPRVVREDLAELIGLDLAEKGRPPAEGGDAGGRIGGRPAGNLRRRAHIVEKLCASVLVDEPHHAFGELVTRRKSSSTRANTSTMALPMVSTSKLQLGHGAFERVGGKARAPTGSLLPRKPVPLPVSRHDHRRFHAFADVLSPEFRGILFKAIGLTLLLLFAVVIAVPIVCSRR